MIMILKRISIQLRAHVNVSRAFAYVFKARVDAFHRNVVAMARSYSRGLSRGRASRSRSRSRRGG